MMNAKDDLNSSDEPDLVGKQKQFVTIFIAGQMFGIPVLDIQDVLGPQKLTWVPLAPSEVAGILNLRGRIVTAIDVRKRLGLSPSDVRDSMSIVVDHQNELYSLIVDSVGEVLNLADNSYERSPATLDALWQELSAGVYRLNEKLMVVLDVSKLLDFENSEAA